MKCLLSIYIYNYLKHVASIENDNHSVNETSRCFVQRMRYTQHRFLILVNIRVPSTEFCENIFGDSRCLEGCNNADANLLSLRLQLVASISQELIAQRFRKRRKTIASMELARAKAR